jgi:hypothetical protein
MKMAEKKICTFQKHTYLAYSTRQYSLKAFLPFSARPHFLKNKNNETNFISSGLPAILHFLYQYFGKRNPQGRYSTANTKSSGYGRLFRNESNG